MIEQVDENPNDILTDAISRRLKASGRKIISNAIFCILSVIVGTGIFVLLWKEFRIDDTQLISQIASLSTSLMSAGAGGFFFQRTISLRDEINEGKDWLVLYNEAREPPPDELLGEIKAKILDWLGRK